MDELKNAEAEQALQAYILRHGDEWHKLAAIVSPEDFYFVPFKWSWMAFGNLAKKEIPIDVISLEDELGRMEHLDGFTLPSNGYHGNIALMHLRDIPTTKSGSGYARIVRDYSRRRHNLRRLSEEAKNVADLSIPLASEDSAGPRYIVHNAADALAPRDPVEWIVKGLIYKKSVTIMYGDGGTKKTWSAMHLAACVSSGVPWGDYEVKKCRVLFVDEENGDDEIAGRAGFCLRGALGGEESDLNYISLAAFHLDDPIDAELVAKEIINQGAELVIFDALADLMLGDENSKQDTQPVFNAFRKIAERTGAALIVIHHANKTGTHRGSSVIKDAPDILLQVTSEPESLFINFKTEKNRKGKAIKWSMKATWLEDSFYLTQVDPDGTDKPKPLSKSQEYVIRFLTEHGESGMDEIMGSADTCSAESARQAVYSLRSQDKIIRTNPGSAGRVMTKWKLP